MLNLPARSDCQIPTAKNRGRDDDDADFVHPVADWCVKGATTVGCEDQQPGGDDDHHDRGKNLLWGQPNRASGASTVGRSNQRHGASNRLPQCTVTRGLHLAC